MDKSNFTTKFAERKKGEHLGSEERGAIEALKRLGYSNRAIAKVICCSPSTVGYELRRGTPEYCGRGRKPKYSAKRGGMVYKSNRKKCRCTKRIPRDSAFLRWMAAQMQIHKWSFDVCVGRARLEGRFSRSEIPSTKTLYSMLWKGELPLTLFDLPEILSRRTRGKPRLSKRLNGNSIDLRPTEVLSRTTFGHWESDTVLGKKCKGEPAVFTIVERLTGCYLCIKIAGKNGTGIEKAMEELAGIFGEQFPQVFKSITTDNGSEFSAFSSFEKYGTQVYFAHPYSSWERPVNERSNREFRKYVPKGKSIHQFTDDQILMFSDEINATPKKRLGYYTAEELFEKQLDLIYAL